jgi:hypothetical protein
MDRTTVTKTITTTMTRETTMPSSLLDLKDLRSVADLEQHYPFMGVPHFQRGLVWDSATVALLLEASTTARRAGH